MHPFCILLEVVRFGRTYFVEWYGTSFLRYHARGYRDYNSDRPASRLRHCEVVFRIDLAGWWPMIGETVLSAGSAVKTIVMALTVPIAASLIIRIWLGVLLAWKQRS